MLKIEQVGKTGWLNTRVTVVATAPLRVDEQRLRSDTLQTVQVEYWQLDISDGERFELALPKGAHLAVGNQLPLETVMRDRPFKSLWRKVDSF